MLAPGAGAAEVGAEYTVTVAFQNGRLRYYINGERIHDITGPEPLPGGRFGLRTWNTTGWWNDVAFGRLPGGSE